MPKPVAGITLERGELLTPQQLAEMPIFQGVAPTALEKNQGAIVLRRFRKGETVCREGEFGSTAFYLLEGLAEVSIASPMAHVRTSGRRRGWFSAMRSFLLSDRADAQREPTRRFIPIDAPVDLDLAKPVATLEPGSLFGEMSCLSFYPRSATVRASTDCVMLEMLRNVLQLLQRGKAFKEELDRTYRERAMNGHLRSVPLFADLTDEFLDHLRDRVELVTVDPFEQDKLKNFVYSEEKATIVREGDPADALYVIRIGFVKVSRRFPGGEMVLAYLGRGGFFGEMGLLEGGVRTATVRALDHVELVRIGAEEFGRIVAEFPDIGESLRQVAADRAAANRERERLASVLPLGDFLDQGLMEAQNLLVLDLERCTRCDECVRGCADAHDGITRLVREGLRFEQYLVATSCRQCRDPLCMIGCPVGSIRRKDSLEIIIEDWCIGCGLCAKQCPYGNINLHPFAVGVEDPEAPGALKAQTREKATTCDLCTDLKEPACVSSCPHEAAFRVDPKVFFEEMAR